jgi:hypothetical protein
MSNGLLQRFNGGMLSVFSYVILYYAFISNVAHATKFLKITLIQQNVAFLRRRRTAGNR